MEGIEGMTIPSTVRHRASQAQSPMAGRAISMTQETGVLQQRPQYLNTLALDILFDTIFHQSRSGPSRSPLILVSKTEGDPEETIWDNDEREYFQCK